LSLSLFTPAPPTEIYPPSLHDALPISRTADREGRRRDPQDSPRNHEPLCWSQHLGPPRAAALSRQQSTCAAYRKRPAETDRSKRSEEHTSELQSRRDLVCRLLLEKKKR